MKYKTRKLIFKIIIVSFAVITFITALSGSFINSRQGKAKRWKFSIVKVYIDPNIKQDLQEGYLDAINNWNSNLKEIQFEVVKENKKANVFLSASTYKDYKEKYKIKSSKSVPDNWLGITAYNYEKLTNFFSYAKVYYNLDNYEDYLIDRKEIITQVAEHELGHVLGLEHDDNHAHKSVMATNGQVNRLSDSDFEKVDTLYKDNPFMFFNPFYKPNNNLKNNEYYE